MQGLAVSTHTPTSLNLVGDAEQVRRRSGDDFVCTKDDVGWASTALLLLLLLLLLLSIGEGDHELHAAQSALAAPHYTEPRIPGAIGRILCLHLRCCQIHNYRAPTSFPHIRREYNASASLSPGTTFAFAVIFHRMESPVRRKIEAIGRSIPVSRRLPALQIV